MRFPKRLALAVVAIAAGAIAGVSVAATQDGADPAVYESQGDPPVYSLGPISEEAADRIRELAETDDDDRQVSAADVDGCLDKEAAGAVDPGCAVILEAHRDGQIPATAATAPRE